MKRPAGLVLVCSFLFLYGLRLLGARPIATEGPARAVFVVLYFALGALSLWTATALWRNKPRALRLYGFWAAFHLIGGAVVQVVTEGTPMTHVLIWWVFAGAVLVAVGFHLRYALRQQV